jgi:hypothetical protein
MARLCIETSRGSLQKEPLKNRSFTVGGGRVAFEATVLAAFGFAMKIKINRFAICYP